MSIKKFLSFGVFLSLLIPATVFAEFPFPYPVPIVFNNATNTSFQLCTNGMFKPIIQEGTFTFPQTLPSGSISPIAFTGIDNRGCQTGTSCLYFLMYYGYHHDCGDLHAILSILVNLNTKGGQTNTCTVATIYNYPYTCHISSNEKGIFITIQDKK